LFRRYKQWHVEIKGDTIFYHRLSALSNISATDAVWYTLDLTWLQDIYLTESHRAHNNELVLQFVQEDQTLHFRLPSKVTTPTLQEWLAAFRRVQRAQQDRRRLGSMAPSLEESYETQTRTTPTHGNQPPRVSESEVQSHMKQVQQEFMRVQPPPEEQQVTTTWPGEDIQPQQRPRGSSLLHVTSNQPTGVTASMSPTSSTSIAPSSTLVDTTPSITTTSYPKEITVDVTQNKTRDLGNIDTTSSTTVSDPMVTRSVAQS